MARKEKTMKKYIIIISVIIIAGCIIMMVPVGGTDVPEGETVNRQKSMDLSGFSGNAPGKELKLLFIHHSCGGQLFADPGEDDGENCIYESHPNGGGLRTLLESQGYSVHEASYASEIGDRTDIFDWLPKFRDKMEKVLKCSNQDTFYTEDDKRNDIVAFKSCYPNNNFVGKGEDPGNPEGPELTVWNARAAYVALLQEFQKYPEVLFICVTAPPLAGKLPPEPMWKHLARRVLNKPRQKRSQTGPFAREFSNWLKTEDGWLKDYAEKNAVVFDYYDILTGSGKSNYCEYPTGRNGANSHPNREGNKLSAEAFVPLVNRAVRRAGLVPQN